MQEIARGKFSFTKGADCRFSGFSYPEMKRSSGTMLLKPRAG